MTDLKTIPAKTEVIYKPDPRIESYSKDAVMTGSPDAVVRPRDWQEVADILKWCNGNNVSVTMCGGRTSMTGASVATEGVLITTDHFNKIIDIGVKDGRGYAVVEPGVNVREFQKLVEEKGFHYPVVPTSCDDAFIGGTVSTNATGEDFYKYGPTRAWVREIDYIKIDGTCGILERETPPLPLGERVGVRGQFTKGHGGYFLGGEEIDQLIGSEGTLAAISRITVDLMPSIPKTFIILIPFTSNLKALAFIDDVNKKGYAPRSLEFIDSTAISLIMTHKSPPKLPEGTKSLVYLKDEYEDIDASLAKWMQIIECPDGTMVATTDKQKEEFHSWRHHIPATISERREGLEAKGGGKVSGDWWVPKEHMLATMKKTYEEVLSLNIEFTMYAHLGDGHPHTTFLCKNAAEKGKAHELILRQSRRAVSLGGGVAGEHGIGKLKRELLARQYTPDIIEKMRRLKESFDPKWLLGRGNILTPINYVQKA